MSSRKDIARSLMFSSGSRGTAPLRGERRRREVTLTRHDHAESGASSSGKTLVSSPGAPHDMHHTLESAERHVKTEHAKRVAGEFVVIVLGVLVALAVDDLRAGRADRDLEAYYLEALTQDLAADTAELRWLLMIQDSVVVAGHRLSKHLDDPLVRPLPAELTDVDVPLARASALVMEPLDFESTRATYDEMVASGSLRVVRSETLRRALAE